MRRTLGNALTASFLSFLSTFSSTTLGNPSHARMSEATEPEVTVLVYNYAGASPEVLTKAEERAAIIFQEVGARVIWVDSADFKKQSQSRSDGPEELESIDVVLRISPGSRAALKNNALGEALPCHLGKDACIANVFMNRVRERTEVEKISLGGVLGHAIAHELGHLLLGSNSHAPRGLMKAEWGPEDMKRAAKGDLVFTPEQARSIRDHLLKSTAARCPHRRCKLLQEGVRCLSSNSRTA